MSLNVLNERSVVLRLEFSIADAVQQRGLIPVIGAAIRAWWDQWPVRYPEVPDYLREDVGLPPADEYRNLFTAPAQQWQFRPPDQENSR
ncbi:hypothetical protein [uncultured Devosia sp.]|uniref:hypothetical protein n=1 Tax=uncultured Devosia sp. TaxID=211434 RepID=UPI002614ED7D|nr:hypothetical protein [uncultured Devosia sp.]